MQVQETLFKLGFAKLNPMQEKAVTEGFMDSQRVVVSAPTASGKTLLALLKIADNFERTKTKALYVVPLRALASEKQVEFERVLAPFGMRVAVSTGDFDSSSESLFEFDVIIVTSEKL
ncbi:MAG: DEAD/DEAH box helicase, partial [Sedimentisphaerales bacterium]|nr:DEAD/DEAH box helicase [Sedimentisphaerales bacterium]